MRITAVFEDNIISVDGVARHVTWSAALAEGWRAIQWDGNGGEIEYGDRNERANDMAIPALLHALWGAGTLLGTEVTAPTDTVALARAAVIDAMVVTAARDPAAPKMPAFFTDFAWLRYDRA